MQGSCDKHLFERAVDVCRVCGHAFCEECVVYSFGADKPPFCVACAVAAAGIRTNAGLRPSGSRRELRRLARQRQKDRVKVDMIASAAKTVVEPEDDPAGKPLVSWGLEWPFEMQAGTAAS